MAVGDQKGKDAPSVPAMTVESGCFHMGGKRKDRRSVRSPASRIYI